MVVWTELLTAPPPPNQDQDSVFHKRVHIVILILGWFRLILARLRNFEIKSLAAISIGVKPGKMSLIFRGPHLRGHHAFFRVFFFYWGSAVNFGVLNGGLTAVPILFTNERDPEKADTSA